MRPQLARRSFVAHLAIAPLAGVAAMAQDRAAPRDAREAAFGETLPPSLVYGFVRAAHLNLSRTRTMLDDEPRLIRAAWEWGPGDFEMGIDGAAHTGSRDIVELLIERGAPYSVFAAATLGDLATVTSMVEAYPTVAHAQGAHEIPLIEHALAGGEPAEAVVAFLREQGAEPREGPKDLPTDAGYRDTVVGRYRLSAQGEELEFRVYVEHDQLFIDAGPLGTNRLQYQGQDVFQIEGTPAQIVFEHADGRAVGALVRQGPPIGRALRIDG